MMSEVIGFLGIVAAAVFVWAFSRHHYLKARQMQHEERITAMQKGLEIPHQERSLDDAPAPLNGARRICYFGPADRDGGPLVVIVNEDFARKEWPDESPVGQRVHLWMGREKEADPDAGWAEVVGLAPSLRFSDFSNEDNQLLGVALLANLVPALRAARVDPMRALRHE